jgi:hypothetical protein
VRVLATARGGARLADYRKAKREKPENRFQNRFCRLLEVLDEKFSNGFKLSAKRTDFSRIIPAADFG